MLKTINSQFALDAWIAASIEPHGPSVSALALLEGEAIYRYSAGFADLENQILATPSSNYRLASVTKQMTAMAVALLQEAGEISYEDRLTKFIPDFPAFAANIRMKHLLNHQSGLIDYEDWLSGVEDYGDAIRRLRLGMTDPPHRLGMKDPPHRLGKTDPCQSHAALRDVDVVEILKQTEKLLFDPGTQYRYSNGGYCLLAEIVRVVSKKSFADFLRDKIFLPLNMTHTVAFEDGISQIAQRAFGYTKNADGGFLKTDQSLTSSTLGDGGVYSSLADLAKWDQALDQETLLPHRVLDHLFTPAHLDDGEVTAYSCGWMFGNHLDRPCIYHTGSTIGFRTILRRYLKPRLTVIVLRNSAEDGVVQKIAEKVAEVCLAS